MRVSMESGKKKNFKKNMKPLLHQLLHNSSIFRLLCCCTKTTNNAYYRNITLFCPFLATISEHNYYMSEIILFFNRSLTPLSFNSKNNFSYQKKRKIFIIFTKRDHLDNKYLQSGAHVRQNTLRFYAGQNAYRRARVVYLFFFLCHAFLGNFFLLHRHF